MNVEKDYFLTKPYSVSREKRYQTDRIMVVVDRANRDIRHWAWKGHAEIVYEEFVNAEMATDEEHVCRIENDEMILFVVYQLSMNFDVDERLKAIYAMFRMKLKYQMKHYVFVLDCVVELLVNELEN